MASQKFRPYPDHRGWFAKIRWHLGMDPLTLRQRNRQLRLENADWKRWLEEAKRNLNHAERSHLDDLETAWGIIANSYGGDWSLAGPDWLQAAERWRDDIWHAALDARK